MASSFCSMIAKLARAGTGGVGGDFGLWILECGLGEGMGRGGEMRSAECGMRNGRGEGERCWGGESEKGHWLQGIGECHSDKDRDLQTVRSGRS